MLHWGSFLWVVIFYIFAAHSQSVLAIEKSSDDRNIFYLTTTKDLVTIVEVLFTFTIVLDGISLPSTVESTSSIQNGIHFADPNSLSLTTTLSSTQSAATLPVSPLSSPSASLSASSTSTNTSSKYVFNSQSKTNVAVYFGQTDATGGTRLAKQCADPNIDIVILAFVVSRNYSGGLYPGVNFGAACGGQTSLMKEEAPGLLFCSELESDIESCQSTYGKKVLLSIGGGGQSIIFNSSSDASAFGGILWDLFGPPGNVDISLRPFGDVSIDGFDINNEDNNNEYYEVLGSTLRTLFSTSASKEFYLSAAPQCPNPDASDPTSLLILCDFVWVQFYNNPPCNIGTPGFNQSLLGWSQTLSSSKARLYLGAPAWPGADKTAYANIGTAQDMETVAKNVKDLGLENFGGIMFWDGAEGMLNQDSGKDIIAWAKMGLAD